jgi:acetyl esterase/lipase
MIPTYIQITGLDPLRDDALAYARALHEHSIRTRVDVYPRIPHRFHAKFSDLQISQKFNRDTVVGFRWLLGLAVDQGSSQHM